MKKKMKWLTLLLVLVLSMGILLVSCAGNGNKPSIDTDKQNTEQGAPDGQKPTDKEEQGGQDKPAGGDTDQGGDPSEKPTTPDPSEKPTDPSEQGNTDQGGDKEEQDKPLTTQDLVKAIKATSEQTNITVAITSQMYGVGEVPEVTSVYRITPDRISITHTDTDSAQADKVYYELRANDWYEYRDGVFEPTGKDSAQEIFDITMVVESYLAEDRVHLFTYQGNGVFSVVIPSQAGAPEQKVSITIQDKKVIELNVTSADGFIQYVYRDQGTTMVETPGTAGLDITYADVEVALRADFNLGSANFTSEIEYEGKAITMTVDKGDMLLVCGDKVFALHNNSGRVTEYGADYYKDEWYKLVGDSQTSYRKWERADDFVARKALKLGVPSGSWYVDGLDLSKYTADSEGRVFTSPSGDTVITMAGGVIASVREVVQVDKDTKVTVVRKYSHYGDTVVTLPNGYPEFAPENIDLNGIDLQYAADNIREQRNFTMTYTKYRTDSTHDGQRYIEEQTIIQIGDNAMYMVQENKETNTVIHSVAKLQDGEWYHWTDGDNGWILAEYGFGDLPHTKQAFIVFEALKESKDATGKIIPGIDLKNFTHYGEGDFGISGRFTNYRAHIHNGMLERIAIIDKAATFVEEREYVYSNIGSTVVQTALPELK